MITVLSIFGTRPEAIKMAPVIQELSKYPGEIKSITCSTGQHREMLYQTLELFRIRPDHELDVMTENQSLSSLSAKLIGVLDTILLEVKPDWILAQGDTTTVMCASLVAYYHGISFGHIEAGLRTGNRHQPFPEEINRRIADLLADSYFAPTPASKMNLVSEGISSERITVTGNTIVDALININQYEYNIENKIIKDISKEQGIVLVTVHRRENFGHVLHNICSAIKTLADTFPNVMFVYPVHLNPNVRGPVFEILHKLHNVKLIDPVSYPVLIQLLRKSILVLTDSGGIQEEAPVFGVPTLVLRDTTERPEGVDAGIAWLVGTNPTMIVDIATQFLSGNAPARTRQFINPYGDGQASRRIVSILRGIQCDEFNPL